MCLLPNLGAAQRGHPSPTHTQPSSQLEPRDSWRISLPIIPSPFVDKPYWGLPVASITFAPLLVIFHLVF